MGNRPGDERRQVAARGEEAAASYLAGRGYRLICRNYRCRLGEADIVARDGDTVVFVEVKARRGVSHGLPQEAVDRRKQARLGRVARHFLSVRGIHDAPCRFDVVAVQLDEEGVSALDLIRGAFTL